MSEVDLKKTTINRYRGTLSMIFQEAIRNGKAKANPARLVRLYPEDNGRVRSITYTEEAISAGSSARGAPFMNRKLPLPSKRECDAGSYMRLDWDRVDFKRRQLILLKTKNGTSRAVILTTAAANALRAASRSAGIPISQRSASPGTVSQ